MGNLVIHNHYREADPEKRKQKILQIIIGIIKRKINS